MYETEYLKLKVAEEDDFYNINENSENLKIIDAKFRELENKNVIKKALLDLAHPIGSIYTSTVSDDPAELFGGKWEPIKDMFLLTAGDTYKAGKTGGEATHTLSAAEMPSHGHTYSGNTDTDKTAHAHTFSANTGTVSADHTHSGWTDAQGQHSHRAYGRLGVASASNERIFLSASSSADTYRDTSVEGLHTHNVGTYGISANHIHGVSGTTGLSSQNHGHAYSGTTERAGSGTAHNNMPPYLVVYAWKRTA